MAFGINFHDALLGQSGALQQNMCHRCRSRRRLANQYTSLFPLNLATPNNGIEVSESKPLPLHKMMMTYLNASADVFQRVSGLQKKQRQVKPTFQSGLADYDVS